MKNQIIVVLIALAGNVGAQEISPEVVTSVGSSFSQGNVTLHFTVGEIKVDTYSSGGAGLGQGFLAAATGLTIAPVTVPMADGLTLNVYPNPATDIVFVDALNLNINEVRIAIVDISGKTIATKSYTTENFKCEFNTISWAKGTYILRVSDANEREIGTYKIVKH